MAVPYTLRGDRERHRDRRAARPESHDVGGQSYELGDEDFERRGYRQGSDYYGNEPGRYGPGNYDAYQEWRYGRPEYERPEYEHRAQYDYESGPESAGSRSFNDRWQDAYRMDIRPTEGPFRGRGPKGYRRSDDRIREDVCERLMEDDWIDASNIDVSVRDHEVTLSGTVHSRDEKRRADDLVERLSGVRDVHNQLRLSEQTGSK